MSFTTFFFDLDETLYPHRNGVWELIAQRINLYMIERLRFPADEVVSIREKYFRQYGTTLRGLQANHQVDMDDYLSFVHDIPLDPILQPDVQLRSVIAGLPGRKFIFTNSDAHHAGRVVEALGLQGLFSGVIDVHTLAPYCKPMPQAFEKALHAAGNPPLEECVLLDDQRRITRAGKLFGFFSILVGEASPGDDADAAIENLYALPDLLQ